MIVCALLLTISGRMVYGGDYLEITVELKSKWESSTMTNFNEATARCVVSTNDWYITGDFVRNAKEEYWLAGSNIIKRRTITSSMYLEQAKDFVLEKLGKQKTQAIAISYPHAGETYTSVHSWREPPFGGMDGPVWFAFCSGKYLKEKGRTVRMLIGPGSSENKFPDKTVVYADGMGLPRSFRLFNSKGESVCEYDVLETTNIPGGTFPLRFQVIQYGNATYASRSSGKSVLQGEVRSITVETMPEMPKVAGVK